MRTVSEAPRCQHVHDSGYTCGSPALRGQNFCYHHHQIHYPRLLPGQKSYQFRSLDGQSAVELFVRNLFQSYHDGHINDSQVRTYLYGVQIMAPYICKGRGTYGLTPEITPAMQQLLGSAATPALDSRAAVESLSSLEVAVSAPSDTNLPAEKSRTPLDTAASSAPGADLPATGNLPTPTEPGRVATASNGPAGSAGYKSQARSSSPAGTDETAPAGPDIQLTCNPVVQITRSSDHPTKKPSQSTTAVDFDLAAFSRLIDHMPADVLPTAESTRIRALVRAARGK